MCQQIFPPTSVGELSIFRGNIKYLKKKTGDFSGTLGILRQVFRSPVMQRLATPIILVPDLQTKMFWFMSNNNQVPNDKQRVYFRAFSESIKGKQQ